MKNGQKLFIDVYCNIINLLCMHGFHDKKWPVLNGNFDHVSREQLKIIVFLF